MSRMKTETIDYLIDSDIDLVRRQVHLYGDINNKRITKVIKLLSILTRTDTNPVTLVMNSEGGFTIDAFALYDYIKSLPVEVTIHVQGRCCSAAVLILQAATHRSSAPNSVFMVHRGTRADKFDLKLDERADKIISDRMGWSLSKFDKFQSYDNYFFAEKALEIGLVDEVLSHDPT